MRSISLTIILALLITACGASARERAIGATLISINAARDAFVAYDLQAQQHILEVSPDKETFDRDIAAYREKRQKIVDKFNGAYRALTAVTLVNADLSFGNLVQAAAHLQAALREFGVLK